MIRTGTTTMRAIVQDADGNADAWHVHLRQNAACRDRITRQIEEGSFQPRGTDLKF